MYLFLFFSAIDFEGPTVGLAYIGTLCADHSVGVIQVRWANNESWLCQKFICNKISFVKHFETLGGKGENYVQFFKFQMIHHVGCWSVSRMYLYLGVTGQLITI